MRMQPLLQPTFTSSLAPNAAPAAPLPALRLRPEPLRVSAIRFRSGVVACSARSQHARPGHPALPGGRPRQAPSLAAHALSALATSHLCHRSQPHAAQGQARPTLRGRAGTRHDRGPSTHWTRRTGWPFAMIPWRWVRMLQLAQHPGARRRCNCCAVLHFVAPLRVQRRPLRARRARLAHPRTTHHQGD